MSRVLKILIPSICGATVPRKSFANFILIPGGQYVASIGSTFNSIIFDAAYPRTVQKIKHLADSKTWHIYLNCHGAYLPKQHMAKLDPVVN